MSRETNMNNSKILVVDDSSTQVFNLQSLLEGAGYSVVTANDGVEAMDYLDSDNPLPNLILSDIVMPNMNGFELCARVKESYKNIPIIILTVHNDEKNLQKAFNAGAVDFLGKPFSETELFIRINNVQEIQKNKIEIKNAKSYFENIINSLSDGLWILNLQGNTIDVSPSMLKISGYDCKEELIRKSPIDITGESDRENTGRIIKETFEKGHFFGESSLIKKNGNIILISASTSLLKDVDGKPIGIIGIIRDITEYKKVEKQLLTANQHLLAGEQKLKSVNRRLEAKKERLQKSQKELNRKLIELVRFNKIMIGRELRMIELKEEVNTLLEKAGQIEKYKVIKKN
jgi:PAS domain S-box-containing protein